MYLRASDRGCVYGEFGARALDVEKSDVFMAFEIFCLFASDHPLPWLVGSSYPGDRSVEETSSGKRAKEKQAAECRSLRDTDAAGRQGEGSPEAVPRGWTPQRVPRGC